METASNEMVAQLKSTPSFRGVAGFLSNFQAYTEDEYHINAGITYRSNEHFYQASKFEDMHTRALIAHHPFQGLKAFVRELPGFNLKHHEIRDSVMLVGLLHKFTIPRYRELLLSTGSEELVERNTWGDTYWGICKDHGSNRLGIILMDIRRRAQIT